MNKSKNIFIAVLVILVLTTMCIHLNVTTIHKGMYRLHVPHVVKIGFFETQYLYWLIHAFTLIPVFILSFDKRVHFYKKWKYMWQGWLVIGTFFIVWDIGKTALGVWSFNPSYIIGCYLYNLPVEELVFFVTIPYACMFIYECLNYYFPYNVPRYYIRIFSWILCLILLILSIMYFEQTYTFITCIIALAYLMYHNLYESERIRGRFYIAFVTTMVPFVFVDGILTGAYQNAPIIIYNPEEYMNILVTSLPIEDAIYLIPLMLGNITLFENLKKLQKNKKT